MIKPKIIIYHVGGTITGKATSPIQTSSYDCGVLSSRDLVKQIPELGEIAQIQTKEITNVGSPDIMPEDLLRLSRDIQSELDHGAYGAVVAHGTDTLEITAFWLELTLRSDKPVAVVGAMRPSTAYSADGPMNLLCAVTLAASPLAMSRGTMIVSSDKIYQPRFTNKTSINSPDAFATTGPGLLGIFYDARPVFYCEPCTPIGHKHFDLSDCRVAERQSVPVVDILHFCPGMRPQQIDEVVNNAGRSNNSTGTSSTAEGVILAGVGAGCWAMDEGRRLLAVLAKRGVPVIASRHQQLVGYIRGDGIYGLENENHGDNYPQSRVPIGSGFLDPQKCRVLLQLALLQGLGLEEIRHLFEH